MEGPLVYGGSDADRPPFFAVHLHENIGAALLANPFDDMSRCHQISKLHAPFIKSKKKRSAGVLLSFAWMVVHQQRDTRSDFVGDSHEWSLTVVQIVHRNPA